MSPMSTLTWDAPLPLDPGVSASVSARRLEPRREGRAESVPEAGGDRRRSGGSADPAVAGHDPDSSAKPTASTGGARRSAREHPTLGRVDVRPGGKAGERPNRERCRSGVFLGGSKGGGAPLARARMSYIA